MSNIPASQILVTGGTGTLGRVIASQLLDGGHDVRVLSRRPAPGRTPYQWHTADLRTNIGLESALDGVGTVMHCASGRGDRVAAVNLIAAARRSGGPHVVYISIVGVDRIPFGYYRTKLDVERMIEASGLPWTTLRTTQFHNLIHNAARALSRSPIVTLPKDVRFQPISVGEVASRLVALALAAPAGGVPDMGGPEIHTASDLVRAYLRVARRRRAIVSIPVPGAVFRAFRAGANLAPANAVGVTTFADYLAESFRNGAEAS